MGVTLYCSFCGKRNDEVAKLIAGPTCFTCNECVELFVNILTENKIPPFDKPQPNDDRAARSQEPIG